MAPGEFPQLVGFAVAAGVQVREDIGGDFVERHLAELGGTGRVAVDIHRGRVGHIESPGFDSESYELVGALAIRREHPRHVRVDVDALRRHVLVRRPRRGDRERERRRRCDLVRQVGCDGEFGHGDSCSGVVSRGSGPIGGQRIQCGAQTVEPCVVHGAEVVAGVSPTDEPIPVSPQYGDVDGEVDVAGAGSCRVERDVRERERSIERRVDREQPIEDRLAGRRSSDDDVWRVIGCLDPVAFWIHVHQHRLVVVGELSGEDRMRIEAESSGVQRLLVFGSHGAQHLPVGRGELVHPTVWRSPPRATRPRAWPPPCRGWNAARTSSRSPPRRRRRASTASTWWTSRFRAGREYRRARRHHRSLECLCRMSRRPHFHGSQAAPSACRRTIVVDVTSGGGRAG